MKCSSDRQIAARLLLVGEQLFGGLCKSDNGVGVVIEIQRQRLIVRRFHLEEQRVEDSLANGSGILQYTGNIDFLNTKPYRHHSNQLCTVFA